LVALTAGVFIIGGAALLGVQYLLVRQLFAQSISTSTIARVDDNGHIESRDVGGAQGDGGHSICSLGDWLCAIQVEHGIGITWNGSGIQSVMVEQTTTLSQRVLSGLLVWSVVVLAVFAVLAVLAARWLSKRSLDRIADITAATRQISSDDLRRRLDLSGPADEIKELGDTIDGMLDRLEDAFTRQDRFIAGASHELRTPLTTTRALLEIPLAQGRVPADLEPALRGALAANQRSDRLIAALLALARARHQDAGWAGGPDGGSADLAATADLVLAERATDIAARGLRLTARTEAEAPAAAEP
jgi:signal transduction histidine kinase